MSEKFSDRQYKGPKIDYSQPRRQIYKDPLTSSEKNDMLRQKAEAAQVKRHDYAIKLLNLLILDKDDEGKTVGRIICLPPNTAEEVKKHLEGTNIDNTRRISDTVKLDGKRRTRYTIGMDMIVRLLKYAQLDPRTVFVGKEVDEQTLNNLATAYERSGPVQGGRSLIEENPGTSPLGG